MIGPVLRVSVTPYYAQVLVITAPDALCPEWQTGDEPAVASPWVIAVATVPDRDSEGAHQVEVDVWVDEAPESDGWTQFLREPILVSQWGIAVQDVLGTRQHHVEVPPGEYEATVYGRPDCLPAQVRIVLAAAT